MKDRVKKVRDSLLSVKPSVCVERARFFTQSMKQTEGEYIALRRAKAFDHVLKNISIFVVDDDMFVGNQASVKRAAPIFPEYATEWIEKELEGDPYYWDERPGDRFMYNRETKEELLDILKYWHHKSMYENLRAAIPKECNDAWTIGAINDDWVSASGIGNQIADFETLLQYGLRHNIEKAECELKALDMTQPGMVKRYWFLQSVIKANQAVIDFAHRYADLCDTLAKDCKSVKRKIELEQMAENCRVVPEYPAKTFWQALQSVWFVLVAEHIELNGHAISIGRFDQYLHPFYQKDIEQGLLTQEQALELIELWFIKVNEINKIRSWGDTASYLGYPMNSNLGIGGIRDDGSDAVNDLTYLCLQACEEIQLPAPSVSVKLNSANTNAFVDRCLQVIQKHRGGMPALYNDEAFTEIMQRMGVPKHDAVNWSPVGCIESCIPGKMDYAAKGASLNCAKVFEMTMYNGKDPATGLTVLPGRGFLKDFKSTEDVFEAFTKQLDQFMKCQVIIEHFNDEMHLKDDINAFQSSLINDCISRGKSLFEGGAIYSAEGGPVIGTNTVADCFAAIEHAVFKCKFFSMEQLWHAVQTNFQDTTTNPSGEEIALILANKCPKFGNDNNDADKWASRIIDYLGKGYTQRYKSSRYGKGPIPATYELSVSSVTSNVPAGKSVGALPNGRLAGEALNNGISPCNGAERNALTAAVKSVGKLPNHWFQKGAIFNVRLSSDILANENGRRNITSLVRTFFQMGGVHIQFNILANEVLQDAKKNPEEYGDLMVRIAGYSAFFTSLSEALQDDLIARSIFNQTN